MAEFCKQFNEATKLHEKDVPIPVILTVQIYSYTWLYIDICVSMLEYI
jgi:ribosomal protein L11